MANQHTQAPHETQRARILAFVRAHPECTTHDLRDSFGIDVMNAGVCLTGLRNAGLVASEREPGELLARWYAVPQKRTPKKQRGVANLATPMPAPRYDRDPLHAALFGAAPAQVAA